MIPAYQFIKDYKNYKIFLRQPGFESIPNAFGKVASFIVQSKTGSVVAIFAFAYSGLDAIKNKSLTEVELLKSGLKIVEEHIDVQEIADDNEYTFEYRGSSFNEVTNPSWWIRT